MDPPDQGLRFWRTARRPPAPVRWPAHTPARKAVQACNMFIVERRPRLMGLCCCHLCRRCRRCCTASMRPGVPTSWPSCSATVLFPLQDAAAKWVHSHAPARAPASQPEPQTATQAAAAVTAAAARLISAPHQPRASKWGAFSGGSTTNQQQPHQRQQEPSMGGSVAVFDAAPTWCQQAGPGAGTGPDAAPTLALPEPPQVRSGAPPCYPPHNGSTSWGSLPKANGGGNSWGARGVPAGPAPATAASESEWGAPLRNPAKSTTQSGALEAGVAVSGPARWRQEQRLAHDPSVRAGSSSPTPAEGRQLPTGTRGGVVGWLLLGCLWVGEPGGPVVAARGQLRPPSSVLPVQQHSSF